MNMTSEPSVLSQHHRCDEDSTGEPPADLSLSSSRRNLVAFYSLSGHTRVLANQIRLAGAGDLEEISEPDSRLGFPGEARALIDSMLRRAPTIRRPEYDPAKYDVLLLGGPVWSGRIAAPVRTYARSYGARARSVAFFCTYDSDGAHSAMQELATLCGRHPEAVLAVPAHALVSGGHEEELHRFIRQVVAAPMKPGKVRSPS